MMGSGRPPSEPCQRQLVTGRGVSHSTMNGGSADGWHPGRWQGFNHGWLIQETKT